MAGLKQTVLSSFLLVLLAASKKLVGLVSTLILARLLTPEDFGIIAIATLAFGLLEVLSNTGTNQYIVTSSKSTRDVLDTAFTYNAILKSSVALLFVILSSFIADYYNDERLVHVFWVFAFMLAFTGFENPQVFLLQREQKYNNIVKMTIIAKVISTAFAITTALITKSYWALVVGQLFAYTLPVIGGYLIAPYRPQFDLRNIRQQFSFSAWLVPSSMLGYFRTQIDTILVSKVFDSAILGSYHVMKYLALIPTLHFIGPMTQPLLAQLSSIKSNSQYFSRMFNVSLFVTLCFAFPISHVIYVHAETIVTFVLGSQWTEYSKFLRIFGLMIVIISIYHQANNCFLIFSKTKMTFYFELFAATCLGIALLLINFNDPFSFAATKLTIEVILTLSLSIYVFITFLSFSVMLKFLGIFTIIVGSGFISSNAAELLSYKPNQFVYMLTWVCIYFIIYISTITLAVFLLKRRINEFDYLWTQASNATAKIIK